MRNERGLRINLASEPLRNVRFYRTLLVTLAVLLAAVAVFASLEFIDRQVRGGRLGREAAALRSSAEHDRLEAKRLEARGRELAKSEKTAVDFANDVILRKSFSWVGLLTRLEQALPSSGVIVSLAPASVGGARAEVVLKAAFRNLNDLLTFIRNLYGRGFSRVRLVSEGKDGFGRLEAELAVVYEGTF